MCILFWTVDNHPKYKFIFAGNRDEFLGRPTEPAHVWPTHLNSNDADDSKNDLSTPSVKVIGGTDLDQEASAYNGTWLGITTDGRVAALTNFREPKYSGKLSRGILARDFLLETKTSVHDYMHQLQSTADQYGGFNLICFDLGSRNDMAYFSNRDKDNRIQSLDSGKIYGLSNSVLRDPWNKVESGRGEIADLLKDDVLTRDQLVDGLFKILKTTKPFSNSGDIAQWLEETKERIFLTKINNKIFGNGRSYGTRTSTVILIDNQDKVTFVERDWYKLDNTDDYRECDLPTSRLFSFKLNSIDIDTNV